MICENCGQTKTGVSYFYPELRIAKRYCEAFPINANIGDSKEALDYYAGFARIKDIPAIRKILIATYKKEAMQYIDEFFDKHRVC